MVCSFCYLLEVVMFNRFVLLAVERLPSIHDHTPTFAHGFQLPPQQLRQ